MLEQDVKRLLLSLTMEERCEAVQMLQESIIRSIRQGTRDEDYFQYLADTMTGVIGEDVFSKEQSFLFVIGRSFLAYKLSQEGYTEYQIGRLIGKDHSTINYLKKKAKEIIDAPQYNRDAFQIWEQFNNSI